ncbi:MAG TPA: aminotransferase class V-fold PLP-dependent enzyme [Hellea balneolensis]|uniref:Aminotransferase class V-fold PLP-dependent enzyme n=1 Tax=Hellea balneolensis TaxID=287478 RepID=A0A7C5M079_9PROT|nr:aminotransferase class V-fold PLP-dependent enzyme [Hellea balneolensis]
MSPLPLASIEKAEQGLAYKAHPWSYQGAHFFEFTEQYRTLAARLIGASPNEIALIPAASYGLQIAANALPLSKGGEILVLADQFPSNVYPWREKAARLGGEVVTVERPQNGDWTQALLQHCNERTEIVAIPAVHWADGGQIDLETIAKKIRTMGAALVLDLTQSLGAMPFDVTTVKPDFMIAAGYKWLMGPYTLGYLYVDPKWKNAKPLEHNWMNRRGSEDFAALVNYQDGFQPGVRALDVGEKSNPAQLLTASASLEQLMDWGIENITRTLGARNANFANKARKMGFSVLPDKLRAPHYLSLGFERGIPGGLVEQLAQENIFVSIRGNSVRVTGHLYSRDEDFERLLNVLQNA